MSGKARPRRRLPKTIHQVAKEGISIIYENVIYEEEQQQEEYIYEEQEGEEFITSWQEDVNSSSQDGQVSEETPIDEEPMKQVLIDDVQENIVENTYDEQQAEEYINLLNDYKQPTGKL